MTSALEKARVALLKDKIQFVANALAAWDGGDPARYADRADPYTALQEEVNRFCGALSGYLEEALRTEEQPPASTAVPDSVVEAMRQNHETACYVYGYHATEAMQAALQTPAFLAWLGGIQQTAFSQGFGTFDCNKADGERTLPGGWEYDEIAVILWNRTTQKSVVGSSVVSFEEAFKQAVDRANIKTEG